MREVAVENWGQNGVCALGTYNRVELYKLHVWDKEADELSRFGFVTCRFVRGGCRRWRVL